uniref:Uncharacterized protein n=1 Tax=Rhizophora mucronata TaxID=61149 RepID=A0A2P2PKD8_RHIMU
MLCNQLNVSAFLVIRRTSPYKVHGARTTDSLSQQPLGKQQMTIQIQRSKYCICRIC